MSTTLVTNTTVDKKTKPKTKQWEWPSAKTLNLIVAGITFATLGILAYALTRPSRLTKQKSKKPTGDDENNKVKSKKFQHTCKQHPLDIHLVMENDEGFNCHIAGDKKKFEIRIKIWCTFGQNWR